MGPRRKWAFDLNSESIPRETLPDPPGFDHGSITTDEGSKTSTQLSKETEMKQKRAMEIAYGPGKNIFMQGFMMWMSGSQINIWSMMITGMALINPIKAIADTNRTFARLDDGKVDLTMPKLVFIVLNIVRPRPRAGSQSCIAPHPRSLPLVAQAGVGVALWKCGKMGLLPLTSADWVSYLSIPVPMERSGIPISW